jgi:GTPase SAR1 family protein
VVGQLTSLQTFALNTNQLTALPEVIGQLTSLQRLALNNNQLTALPEVIGQFTSLQRLLLSNNQLNTLPLSLGQLIDLRQLSLQNNPWRTMPPEVVEKGFKQVITYLRDLAEGAVNRYNAKVLLVGEGQAGKSSLLRALEGKPFIEGLETTHLIVRHPYPCLHPQNATITMSLNVWDFGGQHIYQATHQFFMTGRSLYLVIWNARVGVEQGKLDHWLRNIQVRAPDAPVLLVATHIDQQPADFNFGRYKEAFPQIVDWIGVSNKHSTNIDMLRQKIAELASQLPLMEQQWPERWVTVEQALLADTRYHIDHQEFVDICIEHGITHPEQQETLGSYLHDLGVILYYRKDNYLNDFIVLKPNWLTRAIAHVLDDPIIRDERYGVIQPADLARLWDSPEMPAKYERRLHPLFLHMMKHFLICYPIEARPSGIVDSLIPLHLPFSPPSGLAPWDSLLADQAEVRIRFELKQFTPPGLMSWFIVLAHPYWHKQDYWREGVRLHYEGHLAEVTANPSLNEIWIRVRGAAPSNFFNILHHILRDRIIRAEYQGLTYESKIPCTCSQCTGQTDLNSHFFDYDLLVAQKQRGKRLEVPCPLSDEDVSILELLEGIHYSTHDRIEARLDGMYDLLKDNNGLLEDNKALLVQNLQFSEQLTRESTRMWNLLTQTLSSEAPSTFLLMPGERSGYDPRNLFDQDFTLYLLCQHPAGPHMVPGEKGYSTPRSRDWWAKVTPWLAEIVKYLKYLPKASGVLQAYDEQFYKNIAFNVELFKTVLEVTPDFQDSKARGEVRDITSTSKQFEAQGSALRALHAFLHEVDPVKRWCGLQKVATNDGNILWLCPEHAELHSL